MVSFRADATRAPSNKSSPPTQSDLPPPLELSGNICKTLASLRFALRKVTPPSGYADLFTFVYDVREVLHSNSDHSWFLNSAASFKTPEHRYAAKRCTEMIADCLPKGMLKPQDYTIPCELLDYLSAKRPQRFHPAAVRAGLSGPMPSRSPDETIFQYTRRVDLWAERFYASIKDVPDFAQGTAEAMLTTHIQHYDIRYINRDFDAELPDFETLQDAFEWFHRQPDIASPACTSQHARSSRSTGNPGYQRSRRSQFSNKNTSSSSNSPSQDKTSSNKGGNKGRNKGGNKGVTVMVRQI